MIELKVDGIPVKIDIEEELEIYDVSEEQKQIAAKMAYWGSLWASAESEKIRVDAYYRNWRAQVGMKISEAQPKMAEWKIRQKIEAHPNFNKLKEGQAIATYNATLCKSFYDAFRIKANALQSKGAMMRAELESTGMNTPADSPRTRRRNAESKSRVNSMKDIDWKKKKKKKTK